jgi:hypothetical protein
MHRKVARGGWSAFAALVADLATVAASVHPFALAPPHEIPLERADFLPSSISPDVCHRAQQLHLADESPAATASCEAGKTLQQMWKHYGYDHYDDKEDEKEEEEEEEEELEGLKVEESDNVEEDEWRDVVDYSAMTLIDFWRHFDCETLVQSSDDDEHLLPSIYQPSTWFYLRGLYAGIMGSANSLGSNNSGPKLKDPGYVELSWNTTTADAESGGFRVAVNVRHTRNRGRGIFATVPIQQGELVCVGGDEARFTIGNLYRAFLLSAPTREMRCDIIQFSYLDEQVVDNEPEAEPRPVILVSLNDQAYLNADWTPQGTESNVIGTEQDDDDDNDNDSDEGEAEDENIDAESNKQGEDTCQGKRRPQGGSIEYVASRDIAAGEELVLKYVHFLYDDGWQDFGL